MGTVQFLLHLFWTSNGTSYLKENALNKATVPLTCKSTCTSGDIGPENHFNFWRLVYGRNENLTLLSPLHLVQPGSTKILIIVIFFLLWASCPPPSQQQLVPKLLGTGWRPPLMCSGSAVIVVIVIIIIIIMTSGFSGCFLCKVYLHYFAYRVKL